MTSFEYTLFEYSMIFAAVFIPLFVLSLIWAEFDKHRNPGAWL